MDTAFRPDIIDNTPTHPPVRMEWPDSYLIDPTTNLLSFCSFDESFPAIFSNAMRSNQCVNIAIGDVDNLKYYVETYREAEPLNYGHLAGNYVMTLCGKGTLNWFSQTALNILCVATFGGDEIIVVSRGLSQSIFMDQLEQLAQRLDEAMPCSMTFAAGSFRPAERCKVGESFRQQHIEALIAIERALFDAKKQSKDRRQNRSQIVVVPSVSLSELGWERDT